MSINLCPVCGKVYTSNGEICHDCEIKISAIQNSDEKQMGEEADTPAEQTEETEKISGVEKAKAALHDGMEKLKPVLADGTEKAKSVLNDGMEKIKPAIDSGVKNIKASIDNRAATGNTSMKKGGIAGTKWSTAGMLFGIAVIITGIIIWTCGVSYFDYAEDVSFGGDYYTYQYAATRIAANSLQAILLSIKDSFGIFLIICGGYMVLRFGTLRSILINAQKEEVSDPCVITQADTQTE